MFESRKDLTARVAELETELKETEAALEAAQSKTVEAQAAATQAAQDLDAEKEAHAETQNNLTLAQSTNEELTGELESANGKLATFDKEVDKAAKAKAAIELEKLGHAPLALTPSADDPGTPPEESYSERAAKIEDPKELAVFFKENADKIKAEMFAKK